MKVWRVSRFTVGIRALGFSSSTEFLMLEGNEGMGPGSKVSCGDCTEERTVWNLNPETLQP